MQGHETAGTARVVTTAVLVAGAMALAACKPIVPNGGVSEALVRATPDPGWRDSAAIAGLDSAALARHVAGLEFDTSHAVTDEQRLMVLEKGGMRHGVLARIEPEVGAAMLTRENVKDGRVIARVVVRSPDKITRSTTYATLGIVDSVSHLYVMQFPAVGGTPARWTAFMLGSSGSKVELELDVQDHPRRYPYLSIARWIWSHNDEHLWGTCGPDCCQARQKAVASPS